MLTPQNKRNFFSLFLSQVFSFSIVATLVFSGGLIGVELVDNIKYATLPTAFLIIGNALFAYPASTIMKNYGRKLGFILGNLFSLFGVVLACISIIYSSFILFCMATIFLGFNLSFINQYRFAVVEGVEDKYKNKALSFLILGSMVGAILSLQIIPLSRHWFEIDFLGSYVFLFLMLLLALTSLFFYRNIKENTSNTEASIKSSTSLLSQKFVFSVLVSASAYIAMSSIMVATPLYLKQTMQSSIYSISIVIQSHMIAMFLPSLFSGFLMNEIKKVNLIKIGILLILLAMLVNVAYPSYYAILIGLILLGIGWNFMFITSSMYLVQNFTKEIKFKAQGISELATFSSQAVASLLSGVWLFSFGWESLNLLFAPLFIVLFLFAFSKKLL